MKQFAIRSNHASLAVTEIGGQLSDVNLSLADGRKIAPMHTAPWANESLPEDMPPVIKVLRGDFFCAPFGANDVAADERRGHGLPANGVWKLERSNGRSIEAVLEGKVLGATVTKHVELRDGEAAVYQRHTMSGGSGRLPIGYHAMLRADTELQLGFSPWVMAANPPDLFETPPGGRSMLAPGQTIADLHAARLASGGVTDLTRFPTLDGYDDLWMLASDRTRDLAWTAATCAEGGWVWFGLKNSRVLPETVVWMSNGGRSYAPWSDRHRRVIGLEEVCSYFHLGHAASIGENPFAAKGIPTAVELRPDRPVVASYVFGVANVPSDFGAVTEITVADGGVRLTDVYGAGVFAACDPSFVTSDGLGM